MPFYVFFPFSIPLTGNILGAFSKVVTWLTLFVIDMVLYLCVLIIYTMMSFLCVLSNSDFTWVCASGVSALIVPIFVFGNFPLLDVTDFFFSRLKI